MIKFQASTSPFKWRFRSRRRRCCLSSLFSTTQRCNIILLRYCFEWLQHCSSIATLCCAKTRRCESPRVTSPFLAQHRVQCWSSVAAKFRNDVATMLLLYVALKLVVANRPVCNITDTEKPGDGERRQVGMTWGSVLRGVKVFKRRMHHLFKQNTKK